MPTVTRARANPLLPWHVVWLAFSLVPGGCDSAALSIDSGVTTDLGVTTPSDATVDGPTADLATTRAPFGIDQRPANPSCVAPARPTEMATITQKTVFPNLTFDNAVLMLQPPGDATRWYVVQQGGIIKTFPNKPDAMPSDLSVVLDISAKVNSSYSETGLLGMAFHPNYTTNHEVFLFYSAFSATSPANARSTLSRFTLSADGKTIDPMSESNPPLWGLDKPEFNHNGGMIDFGPDGYLYISVGDGGGGGDMHGTIGNGQDTNVYFGKMLRINVDSGSPYSSPPSNPFFNGGGKPEIYAYGLRNPWRWSFDRATGDLFLGDVGQNLYEEVDQIQLGGNYGWREKEGFQCYAVMPCMIGGLIDPLANYGHDQGTAVIGGYVYRGTTIPALVGTYIYGDYSSGRLWGLFPDAMTGKLAPELLTESGLTISSFGQGEDGEVYIVEYGGAKHLHQLTPMGPAPSPSPFPLLLSATGCVDPNDATRPAAGLIPYDLNVPLWSDGAAKQRWMALPDGAKISIAADGHFDFPNGTVLMKQFSLAGKRIETRLFMHHPDGQWAGYSYEWNDAGTDAVLLPAGKSKTVGAQSWTFPSRAQCVECHTAAAGRSLGPEVAQLNRDLAYGPLESNELDTLAHIGLFDGPLPSPAPQYPTLDGSDTVEHRARAYLQANCSICHRPGGTGQGVADFRYITDWKSVGVCNAMPTQGNLGVTGALVVAPGSAAHSILSLRMHALDVNRMPPLASHVVDPTGTALIDAWIGALTSCP